MPIGLNATLVTNFFMSAQYSQGKAADAVPYDDLRTSSDGAEGLGRVPNDGFCSAAGRLQRQRFEAPGRPKAPAWAARRERLDPAWRREAWPGAVACDHPVGRRAGRLAAAMPSTDQPAQVGFAQHRAVQVGAQ